MEDEMCEITKKLRLGFALDLRKPEIDKFERATIIRKVMDDNKWSVRQFSTNIGVSHSTVQDWLLFNNISEAEYEKQRKKGVSESEIYKTLRNKTKHSEEGNTIEGYESIDYKITKFESDIQSAINQGVFSKYTQDLLTELIPVLQKFNHSIRARK